MTLPILKSAPPLALRREPVELPELGGSVIVRGLLGSELFAIQALRQRALRVNAPEPEPEGPDTPLAGPPEITLAQLAGYGRHVSEMLALAVQDGDGVGLYSADEWEIFAQHYPDAYSRLHRVAERLSGMDLQATEKNSSQSQSGSSSSGSASATPAAPSSSVSA